MCVVLSRVQPKLMAYSRWHELENVSSWRYEPFANRFEQPPKKWKIRG